jgi:cyclophilin family peptidyl-prolyl cis-trans isomerase
VTTLQESVTYIACMNRRLIIFLFTLGAGAASLIAANVPPVIKTQIADQTFYADTTTKIDLTNAFNDPDMKAVRFATVLGNVDVQLFSAQKPITVTNFLRYVDQGRYFKIDPTTHHRASHFIHRSATDFVIQAGGYIATVNTSDVNTVTPTAVVTFPSIQNEPGISNTRGSIAMAKTATGPDTATSQWFINLEDNGGAPHNLDTTNGGFTVFGQVIRNGMINVDKVAALPTFNFNPPFDQLPTRNYNPANQLQISNLVLVPDIIQIPPFDFLAFSNNTTVATASIDADKRRVVITAKQPGSAVVSVRATDFDGAFVTQHFNVTVLASPGRLVNISTRLQVQADPNELIAGFIVGGTSPKHVLIRAIGPSLAANHIANPLGDPVLELHDDHSTLATNDDWGDSTNRQQIEDTDIPPTASSESSILATLPANNATYTAIVRGMSGTGVGLVEIYDLDRGPDSRLANISSRGFVQTGEDVMIAGFIILGNTSAKIGIRGIGPSLSPGIANPLNDPVLELRNAQGVKIAGNNDWQTNANAADIQAAGIAPMNPHESALLTTQPAGNYTAILSGTGLRPTGVGVVEVYHIQ